MKCCVTGATGCVGRNLVDELLKDGWKVIVLHRSQSDLSKLNGCDVEFRQIYSKNLNIIERNIPKNTDAVFHCAGNVSHSNKYKICQQQYDDNVVFTSLLARASVNKNVGRFIYTSTGATKEYDHYDLEFAKKIKSNYIKTKRISEINLENMYNTLDFVVIRPIIVIGKYDYNNYGKIFDYIENEGKLVFDGRLVFCHAQDVARVHIEAFHKGTKGDSYMLDGTYTTWLDVFQRIAKLVGVDIPEKPTKNKLKLLSYFHKEITPEFLELVKDAPNITNYEKRKLRQLGYKSQPLDKALLDFYEWRKNAKQIQSN